MRLTLRGVKDRTQSIGCRSWSSELRVFWFDDLGVDDLVFNCVWFIARPLARHRKSAGRHLLSEILSSRDRAHDAE